MQRVGRLGVFFVCLTISLESFAATVNGLFDAIMRRDQKAVMALLKQGAPVNSSRPDGSTPLAWAVQREDPEIATALIQAGANVNAADENGETPLSLACANGNLALTRMLLDAKADVGAK